MKKIISLVALAVLALSVVGCSSTTATDTNASAPVAEANTPAEAK